MRTAKEIAENMVLYSRQDRFASAVKLKEAFVSEIESYANERVAEKTKDRYPKWEVEVEKIEARNDALEQAAKVARENCLGSNTHATNETCPTAVEILKLKSPDAATRIK